MLNYALIKNPFNWAIIFLMVFIGSIAIHFILEYQTSPSSGVKK